MLRTKKPKRHVSCQKRMERQVAEGMDESWSMDFMSDELFDGRRIRLLTIVDNFTRESLAIRAAASIRGQGRRGCPAASQGAAPAAQDHTGGQWARVHIEAPGPVGLSERGGAGLQPSREAHGQRHHRVIQRPVPAGMPERELVSVPGGCGGKGGKSWRRPLQWGKAPQRPGKPVPQGVRRAGGNRRLTRETSIIAGIENGAASAWYCLPSTMVGDGGPELTVDSTIFELMMAL